MEVRGVQGNSAQVIQGNRVLEQVGRLHVQLTIAEENLAQANREISNLRAQLVQAQEQLTEYENAKKEAKAPPETA